MRRVAITSFGIASAIGSGREAFWEALMQGQTGIAPITRFDASGYAVQLAGEVRDMPELPQEVARIAHADVKVGFAWAACREALENAGLDRIDNETLLHIGTSLEAFDLRKLIHNGRADFKQTLEKNLVPGGSLLQVPLDYAARCIAASFGRPGQTLVNCSACAAGAQALGHAFQCIRNGRFEQAMCGGFDSMINPLGVGGFQLLGALTTDNDRAATACRPFDSTRSGTVLGEGAAMFVLEPLEKAVADGKTILAEICGYGSTCDAHNLSAPDPEGDGAARAMLVALEDAGIKPEQIGHINAHGTGTLLNDEVEARAIRRVFDGCWQKIPVSATKSMTGHCIAAAGAIEIGACLGVAWTGLLPPNVSLSRVGKGCELDHVMEAGRKMDGEYILSNSFGFGGQNAALVLRIK